MNERLPSVTALVAAYDAEDFIAEAQRSALDQDYPPELLDVIVVDDGSTDATAAVVEDVARGAGGRVRLLRQANRGNTAATERAVGHLHSELTAILDADDVWPADKLRRQVGALAGAAGLVYGDMTVIDAEGKVLQESWLEGETPPEGRCVGALLAGNLVTGSSIVVRTSLLREIVPIPADIAWTDWWLALRAAQLTGIAYRAEPRTLYRYHGGNLNLGVQGLARRREVSKAARLQRWFLRRLRPGEASARELHDAWEAFERNAGEAAALSPTPFAPGFEVTEGDRRAAVRLTAAAGESLACGAFEDAAIAFVHAAAADPWHAPAREGLAAALLAMPGGDELPGTHPLDGAREFVVLARAAELLADPGLLEAYAGEMRDIDGVTLVIDADGMEAAVAGAALGRLAERAGIAGDESLDVLLVPGALNAIARARLAAGAAAVYTTVAQLPALRAAATSRVAAA
jgi:glycosyltransferase involved in cell wall biosynthesis